MHTHLLLSRTQVSRLGQLDLAMALDRIASNFFRAYVRCIVNLPQLLRLVMDERTGYLSGISASVSTRMTLDPTGDHICSSCTSDATGSSTRPSLRRPSRPSPTGWIWCESVTVADRQRTAGIPQPKRGAGVCLFSLRRLRDWRPDVIESQGNTPKNMF